MKLKKGKIIYKFSIKGVRKVRVIENDNHYVTLQDINNPLCLTYTIDHPELMFIGRTHEECVKNTLTEIKRLADIKLYNLSNVE